MPIWGAVVYTQLSFASSNLAILFVSAELIVMSRLGDSFFLLRRDLYMLLRSDRVDIIFELFDPIPDRLNGVLPRGSWILSGNAEYRIHQIILSADWRAGFRINRDGTFGS